METLKDYYDTNFKADKGQDFDQLGYYYMKQLKRAYRWRKIKISRAEKLLVLLAIIFIAGFINGVLLTVIFIK